jgi:competence protein ComEA
MRDLTRKETIGLMALLTLITAIVGVSVVRSSRSTVPPGILLREPPVRAAVVSTAPHPVADSDAPAQVVVHVAGAVNKPGVYHLPPEARGEDALRAAGGPKKDANTDAINLAAHVEDGSQLYIPTRKEQSEGGAPPVADVSAASIPEMPAPTKSVARARPSHRESRRGSKPDKLTIPGQGQINLNTASAEELQRLPGVGPAMAARLLAFRQENHGFRSVEDLLQVSGIGEKKFAKLRPFVTVK